MKKIVKYDLVSSNAMLGLPDLVNDAISKGWQPYGFVTIDANKWYSQVMVKYDTDESGTLINW